MENYKKYSVGYFLPPEKCMEWTKKDHVDKAPVWCSVDLRDGNQALVIPMSLEEKLEFFKHLVKIGFKEIEVGFPAASATEYQFLRKLIDEKIVPDDVTLQVLTQSRRHIIRKTFDAIKGAPKAVVHLYNSTSVAQREQVFKKSKEEIIKIATDGAELIKEYAEKAAETEGCAAGGREPGLCPRYHERSADLGQCALLRADCPGQIPAPPADQNLRGNREPVLRREGRGQRHPGRDGEGYFPSAAEPLDRQDPADSGCGHGGSREDREGGQQHLYRDGCPLRLY